MADLRLFGSTSNLVRFVLKKADTGQGITGLDTASPGLIISTIADNEATATTYTVAGSTIETISTLGTYAAPTATKCRFKEVDATNHKGLYEFQFADARFAVASSKRLVISVTGATNLLDSDYEIELVQFNPFDAVRMGMAALPNASFATVGGLNSFILGSGTADSCTTAALVDTLTDLGSNYYPGMIIGVNGTTLGTATQWRIIKSTSYGAGAYTFTFDRALDTGPTGVITYIILNTPMVIGMNSAEVSLAVDQSDAGMAAIANLDQTMSSRLAAASYFDPSSDLADIQSRLPAALTGAGNIKADAQVVSDKTNYVLDAAQNYANAGSVGSVVGLDPADVVKTRKHITNKSVTDPATGVMTVYDDDGTTPLVTADLFADVAGTTPYDGTNVINRRDGFA